MTVYAAADTYRNLVRHCVSIRTGGRVVAHPDVVAVYGVTFRVQLGTVATVRRKGVRAVCAYARGDAEVLAVLPDLSGCEPLHFNPLVSDHFHTEDGRAVVAADVLYMASPSGAWVRGARYAHDA